MPGSRMSKVVAFFEENPDEELLIYDALLKFGGTERQLQEGFKYLVSYGYLERYGSTMPGRPYIYRRRHEVQETTPRG